MACEDALAVEWFKGFEVGGFFGGGASKRCGGRERVGEPLVVWWLWRTRCRALSFVSLKAWSGDWVGFLRGEAVEHRLSEVWCLLC